MTILLYKKVFKLNTSKTQTVFFNEPSKLTQTGQQYSYRVIIVDNRSVIEPLNIILAGDGYRFLVASEVRFLDILCSVRCLCRILPTHCMATT